MMPCSPFCDCFSCFFFGTLTNEAFHVSRGVFFFFFCCILFGHAEDVDDDDDDDRDNNDDDDYDDDITMRTFMLHASSL